VIEYDVLFTGHWGEFLSAFRDNDADFLASHLRDHHEEPDWFFWNSIQAPDRNDSVRRLVRAFCPVQRVSRRALQLLEVKIQQGWVGHFECLVPTLLRDSGYTLADIGGDGTYVPDALRNRFYTSLTWRDGTLRHFGSMRFRPPFHSFWHARENTLYHPVKRRPERFMWRPALADLKQKVSYAVWNLVKHPLDFSRALARL
jgi:hypothetical protein